MSTILNYAQMSSSSESDYQFDTACADADNTVVVQAGRLKIGSLLIMKGFPCAVTSFFTAKTGKHGSCKAMICAKDIFTGKAYEETYGTKQMIRAPHVTVGEYTVLDCQDDGFLCLQKADGSLKEDLGLKDFQRELHSAIKHCISADKHDCLVRVQNWAGQELVLAMREGEPH